MRAPGPTEHIQTLDGRATPPMHAWMRDLTRTVDGVTEGLAALVAALPAVMVRGTEAPTTGAHVVGEIVWNTVPSSGGNIGWVCTTAGTPGTWKAWGTIA